jgi:hypothetical protein
MSNLNDLNGRRFALSTAVLAGALMAVLLSVNFDYLFHHRLFESGDIAANSLEVDEAKLGRLIYGNYSRWHFHHPGPVFFYLYAGGEYLFHDLLRIVPTAYNAQLLALLIISSTFFAATINTVVRRSRSCWILPCALLLAVLHFSNEGSEAFLNNWPPFVLVTPFMCFLTAAASVAMGYGSDLILMVVAGSFLVHGHVAQALFVLPIALLAYIGLTLATREAGVNLFRLILRPAARFPMAHTWSALIFVLMCVPILIDITKGPESNLAAILAHLNYQRTPPHPLRNVAVYFLQYAAYAPSRGESLLPETLTRAEAWSILRRALGVRLVWLGVFASVAAAACLAILSSFFRTRRHRLLLPPFLGPFSVVIFVALVLSLFWARTQDGSMYYFNSWFNYGLYFCAGLAVLVWVAGFVEPATNERLKRGVNLGLWLLVLVCLVVRWPRFATHTFDADSDRRVADSAERELREDGAPRSATRLLVFNPGEWPEVTAAALQLERLGVNVKVAPEWAFMFGSQHVIQDLLPEGHRDEDNTNSAQIRVWRVLPLGENRDADRHPIGPQYGVTAQPEEIDPSRGWRVNFSNDMRGAGQFLVYGFADRAPQAASVWSVGKFACVWFVPKPLPDHKTVGIRFRAYPFTGGIKSLSQHVELWLGDSVLARWTITKEDWYQAAASAKLWNAISRPTLLTWKFPNAVSPAELGESHDTRKIALGFEEIQIGILTD